MHDDVGARPNRRCFADECLGDCHFHGVRHFFPAPNRAGVETWQRAANNTRTEICLGDRLGHFRILGVAQCATLAVYFACTVSLDRKS